jgi:hypothetical protein
MSMCVFLTGFREVWWARVWVTELARAFGLFPGCFFSLLLAHSCYPWAFYVAEFSIGAFPNMGCSIFNCKDILTVSSSCSGRACQLLGDMLSLTIWNLNKMFWTVFFGVDLVLFWILQSWMVLWLIFAYITHLQMLRRPGGWGNMCCRVLWFCDQKFTYMQCKVWLSILIVASWWVMYLFLLICVNVLHMVFVTMFEVFECDFWSFLIWNCCSILVAASWWV